MSVSKNAIRVMPRLAKAQRIRDPLHNLIEFKNEQFEQTLWQVIQTQPFQRLRRVKQLGFSELVFPGATHTRFAHSVGVFHTARQLMELIKRHSGSDFRVHQSEVALAASLVHDVGHGMFSHAFEDVRKTLNLPMEKHEDISIKLIREGEIAEILQELGSGFANDVANVLRDGAPENLYESVVSSQFDADRLDYMQRDRLMTGVQSSGVDATWLMANLEVGSVPMGADDESSGKVDTLVLGPKAFHAAENYVLSLFQLYPNVYFHKTTRVAEKMFTSMMVNIINLIGEGAADKVGLPQNHPIQRFANDPSNLVNVLALDDAVFWGAQAMLAEAGDPLVRRYAKNFLERRLPKCIDIRRFLEEQNPVKSGMAADERQGREAELRVKCKNILERIREVASKRESDQPHILVDESRRTPYKKYQDSRTPLDQILIRHGEGQYLDMASLSSVVSSAESYEVCRAYHDADDTEGKSVIENIMRTN